MVVSQHCAIKPRAFSNVAWLLAMIVHTLWSVNDGAAEDPMKTWGGGFLAGFQLVSSCYIIDGPQGL